MRDLVYLSPLFLPCIQVNVVRSQLLSEFVCIRIVTKVKFTIRKWKKIAYCTAITKNKPDLAYLFKYMKG
jgi:hypothetical protein